MGILRVFQGNCSQEFSAVEIHGGESGTRFPPLSASRGDD
jgi:hypothetical protein